MPVGPSGRSAWTRVNDGALHAGSSSESSPFVPFPRRPHQRGTSDRGSPLAAHHVDGSLAAVFRRNLVSLRAATRTRRLHIGVSRGGIGGLLVRRDSRRIIIAAVPIVIVPVGYGQAAGTLAVLESTGEVSAAQAATDATATHGATEMPAANAPTDAGTKVHTHHRTAGQSAPHASAPNTDSAASARSGVGRHCGTSQCRRNNNDCNSVQHKFLHGCYLLLFQITQHVAARSASMESSDLT